jgi:adenine-specific DNA-methyltransferase
MNMAKAHQTKLELTWVGKDELPRLEPRILLEQPEQSYAAPPKGEGSTFFDNMLIHGDNLLALKALEADYAGKVKCVFIDPPYNTGSAFAHYDDGLEHSLWLTLMRDRLVLLRRLLSDSGSIWITVDDNEAHYLKVLCDEIFGRKNFVSTFAWEKDQARHNDALISSAHDHILLYVKEIDVWKRVRKLLRWRSTGATRHRRAQPEWPVGDRRREVQERAHAFAGRHVPDDCLLPGHGRHRRRAGRCRRGAGASLPDSRRRHHGPHDARRPHIVGDARS